MEPPIFTKDQKVIIRLRGEGYDWLEGFIGMTTDCHKSMVVAVDEGLPLWACAIDPVSCKQMVVLLWEGDHYVDIFSGMSFEIKVAFTISLDGDSITCHTCGLTSFNPNDVSNRYCGHCHKFHLTENQPTPQP